MSLQIQNSLADVGRTESALPSNMLQNSLARGCLCQRSYRVGVIPAESWLSSAVFTAHSDKADFTGFIASYSIRLCQFAGFHLGHSNEKCIRDQIAVFH